MRSFLKVIKSRVFVVSFLILFQLVLIILFTSSWRSKPVLSFLYYFLYFLGGLVAVKVVCDKSHPTYKIAWIITIFIFPVCGAVFYFLFGKTRLSKRSLRKLSGIETRMKEELLSGSDGLSEVIKTDNGDAANQSKYITDFAYCPPYTHTYTEYLPSGEKKLEKLLTELEKAKKFIFLEYFIIGEGKMWSSVLEILERKAASGVDVRVIFDDLGCIRHLPDGYETVLEKKGIRCGVFNPFLPILRGSMNNRDHRKICVIDGIAGFTGGINLADEYINEKIRFGHWKDSSVFIRGEAVWSLTVMFLSMWEYVKNTKEKYALYRPDMTVTESIPTNGVVQPFADSPFDDEAVGENVYINMINRAHRYVYITTPYLIIDSTVVTALSNAAKSGVDVRIITPHIPDKKLVHIVTRSYYSQLIEQGVKIYEYTPGFIHAKSFVCDDRFAVVGTINLDYRSLYLHFECAVWMYRAESVLDVRDDFTETLKKSGEYTLEMCRNQNMFKRIAGAALRIFAPLL